MTMTLKRIKDRIFISVLVIFVLLAWSAIERPGHGLHDREQNRLSQYGSGTLKTRAHDLDQFLPYQCGMVFFYHVPSTGGATLNQWLRSYSNEKDEGGKFEYFQSWERANDGRGKAAIQKRFIYGKGKKGNGMNEFVKKITPHEWRIAQCHHSSLNLNVSEHFLTQWRHTVEAQGCNFIANVIFRDPLSHTLSLFKHLKRYNSTREEWLKHLHNVSELGPWQTQLDYFLYNLLERNPDGVSKEAKVKRGLDLLRDHFDIVTIGNHDGQKRELLKRTGWHDLEMFRTNTHPKDIPTTKREVEDIQKLLNDNGDTDFIEGVKYMYKGLF